MEVCQRSRSPHSSCLHPGKSRCAESLVDRCPRQPRFDVLRTLLCHRRTSARCIHKTRLRMDGFNSKILDACAFADSKSFRLEQKCSHVQFFFTINLFAYSESRLVQQCATCKCMFCMAWDDQFASVALQHQHQVTRGGASA